MAKTAVLRTALLLGVFLCTGAAARAQMSNGSAQYPSLNGQARGSQVSDAIDAASRERMEAQRDKALRDERHRKMLADADRLLKLATELKEEVDKTTKDELSVTVVKKAADIEKLAHDVRNRMIN